MIKNFVTKDKLEGMTLREKVHAFEKQIWHLKEVLAEHGDDLPPCFRVKVMHNVRHCEQLRRELVQHTERLLKTCSLN